MATALPRKQRPTRDFPYTMRFADGRTLALEVPARMVVRDGGGEIAFTPEGARFLDRLRSLYMPLDRAPSPGYIRTLRDALGMTQRELGEVLGVDKLTVSRWERGELKPANRSVALIQKLRARALRRGVTLPG